MRSPQKVRGFEEGGTGVDWALSTGKDAGARSGLDSFADSAKWSEGGRYLASIGMDAFNSVVVWDLRDCSKVSSVYGARDLIHAVAFGTGNDTLVT